MKDFIRKLKSKKEFYTVFFLVLVASIIYLSWYFFQSKPKQPIADNQSTTVNRSPSPTPYTLPPIPLSKILFTDYHIFQTFNNCGPAALSMALRFYGIDISQTELGNALRPYQVPNGDNDDKSVTLDELAEKSIEYGFIPFHRPMGNPKLVRQFIANGMPIITRTWTKSNEDIGHYRVIKGYDETAGVFIQDDSLQNKNLEYTYEEFNEIWKKFNYEYLVLVPKEKVVIAEQILGENKDVKIAWQNAVINSENELELNQNDIYAGFNLSVSLYNTGNFKRSAEEFEKVEDKLPFRTLWYQIEPIMSYQKLKKYDRVFEITDRILNNENRAFSELYYIRGEIYQEQGNIDLARTEFEKAVFYNKNFKQAQEALESL